LIIFSSTITQQTPAGPMFFYAAPNKRPNLETSKFLVGKLDVMLQTKGYPLESGI